MTAPKPCSIASVDGCATSAPDPVRQAFTVMISESVGGIVTVVVGKRNLSTKRYTFVRMAERSWPPHQRSPLWMLLQKVAWMAETDQELTQL